jgi:hypothetical protein
VVLLDPSLGRPAAMMQGHLGHVHAEVHGEQPVQILSESWDVRRTRRIKGTPLKRDDLC